jgi:hypothetical protein
MFLILSTLEAESSGHEFEFCMSIPPVAGNQRRAEAEKETTITYI